MLAVLVWDTPSSSSCYNMLAAFSVGSSLPVAAAKMLAAFSVGTSLPVAAAKTC